MQRIEYETYMTDVLVTHELMAFYGTNSKLKLVHSSPVLIHCLFCITGKGGIPGVTYGSCLALCEATRQDERARHSEHCTAIGFKRGAPYSYTDQTGWCFLLQNAGGCKLADFSAELLVRNIESERQCSASAPGLDSAQPRLNTHPHPPRRL